MIGSAASASMPAMEPDFSRGACAEEFRSTRARSSCSWPAAGRGEHSSWRPRRSTGTFKDALNRLLHGNQAAGGSTHVRASWHGATLAETHDTIVVEGNHYFPPDSIDRHFFRDSSERSVCPWKGLASYFDVVVDGEVNAGAAWYYPEPKAAAAQIKDRVAFWRGVRVERVPTAETASPAD